METDQPRIAEGTGAAAESNEHDYAHTTDPPEPVPNSALQPPEPARLELPEPALGAEVDCPGVSEQEEPAVSCAEAAPRGSGSRRPKRPEDRNCSGCRLLFQRQGRSFNRRAVYTFTTPDTVRWVFPDSEVHEKSFLCETCAQIIRTKGRRKQSGKRLLWVKPPEVTKVKDKQVTGRRMGKKSKAALLVSKSSYKAAFQMLWSSKGARKPMMDFWRKQLKNEMKLLSRKADSPFHQKVSGRKPLSSFPWRRCLNWVQENAPLVTTCLHSMFPDINTLYKSSHQLTEDQAVTLLERRTVVALSIPLFTRNIWRNNFLQAALGAELRLQGCSGSALDTLNTMGLCQNKDTVRLLLHRLRNGKDMDGEHSMMLKHEQMKDDIVSVTTEEEEEDEEEDDDDDEEEEEEEEEQQDEMLVAVEEEVEQEEVQDGLQEEEEDPAMMEKEERKRRKKAKKQRREEKRKERRGKRKEREEPEEDEEEDEDGLEQKKRKVVVVRLGLLKGTSEVGRSDLSAP
ncbi:PREDICTED: nucleoporin GLE1-like isoform X2 [Cyprinodon variegatus]|uniref:nucleoporin GLE1-like isoform X2 n=1 Tax=Cyprinodon variegatus TaxID=28743 RepID=UPI000742954B|nr:PREDICTED: nucleoporin GLE1-like isoform X2 [Cyprinodon variegatus]